MNYKRLFYSFSALTILLGGVTSTTAASADVSQSPAVSSANGQEVTPRWNGDPADPSIWNPSHPWWNHTPSDGMLIIVNGVVQDPGNGRFQSAPDTYIFGRVIDYRFEDGTTASESVTDTVSENFSFGWWNDGTVTSIFSVPGPLSVEAVVSPAIPGYTPDVEVVPSDTLTFSDAVDDVIHVTVTYKANEETPAPEEDTPANLETPKEDAPDTPAVPASPAPVSPIGDLEKISQVETDPIVTAASPVVAASKAEGARLLPATGDDAEDTAILAVGVTMLAAGAVGLAAQSRRKKL